MQATLVSIGIAESGWPSAGQEPYTSKEIFHMYNANLNFSCGKARLSSGCIHI